MATFAGFAPANDPALSAIVVLNRPQPIYGGTVAAPVFSEIMQYALHRYDIATSPGGGTTGGRASSIAFPPPPSVTANTVAPSTTKAVASAAGTIGAASGNATEGP
jgi:hypothetical protein